MLVLTPIHTREAVTLALKFVQYCHIIRISDLQLRPAITHISSRVLSASIGTLIIYA